MSCHHRPFTNALIRTAGVFVCLAATVASIYAQGVTGTVSGTVKDPQGLVVPGAVVVLISEARGTLSTPVVTNSAGDFVFPNVTADTYTIQVEMTSFGQIHGGVTSTTTSEERR